MFEMDQVKISCHFGVTGIAAREILLGSLWGIDGMDFWMESAKAGGEYTAVPKRLAEGVLGMVMDLLDSPEGTDGD